MVTMRYIKHLNLDLCFSPFPQLDTEYRKKWDSLVIKLEVVDRDGSTGSEIVHWATHFPVSSCCLLFLGRRLFVFLNVFT